MAPLGGSRRCGSAYSFRAGQDFAYILKLLRGFKAQTASDLDGAMTMAAQPLTQEDIENLTHFIASLGSER